MLNQLSLEDQKNEWVAPTVEALDLSKTESGTIGPEGSGGNGSS